MPAASVSVDRRARQARHELGRQAVAELSVEIVGADDAFGEPDPGIGVLVREPGATDHADRRRAGALERLRERLSATSPSASCQVGGTKPVSDRTSGWLRRSGASTASKPKRPRSHSQLWFTGSESTPRYRTSAPADDWATMRQPTAQVVHVVSTCSRSHGRGLEAVRRRRERADRADLDRVAGEVGREGVAGEDRDLDPVATLREVDEGLARHLLGKTGAARALDAALPIEQHERADLDGLGPVPFLLDEPALSRPVGHRLVLEGALASLVADGAVERVVEEQELEHALLGLSGRLGLGEDLLAVGHLDEAGRLQARAPGTGDLDEAHAAHADRLHPRVVAKARDEDPGPLGRRDDELALAAPPRPARRR